MCRRHGCNRWTAATSSRTTKPNRRLFISVSAWKKGLSSHWDVLALSIQPHSAFDKRRGATRGGYNGWAHPSCPTPVINNCWIRSGKPFRSRFRIRSTTRISCFRSSAALEQVDALKSQAPVLGTPCQPNYAAARYDRLPPDGQRLEQVIPELVKYLHGMFIWGHPRSQLNIVPQPTIASIIGVLLPSIYNPNMCSDESAVRMAEAEVRVAAMTAGMVGYDPKPSAGVFTFGGTGGLLYGVRIGLEKALPGSGQYGLREKTVVLTSQQGHYATLNVAAWLGIGQENVLAVPTHADNSMRLDLLEKTARQALSEGCKIAAIIATLGTTDAFGLDDLEGISALCDRLVAEFSLDYRPHIHADAVIGWAWSAFNDYDWLGNELGFRGRTVRRWRPRPIAFGTCRWRTRSASIFIKPASRPTFRRWCWSAAAKISIESLGPAKLCPICFSRANTIRRCTRWKQPAAAAVALSALASLLLLGKEGLRVLLGHAVEMAEVLRERIESHPNSRSSTAATSARSRCSAPIPTASTRSRSKTASRPTRVIASACWSTTNTIGGSIGACMPRRWPAGAW